MPDHVCNQHSGFGVRLDSLDGRLDSIDERLDRIERKIDAAAESRVRVKILWATFVAVVGASLMGLLGWAGVVITDTVAAAKHQKASTLP